MGRILIADSDPHVLLLCRDELQEEGYEVLLAANAQEALELTEQSCPDLVVMEIMLPDMSGFETLRIIKGTCRQTPVIFHSTYGLPQHHCHCQVDGFVVKTHNLEPLKNKVQGLLGTRRSSSRTGRRSGRLASRCTAGECYGVHGN
ncbi:MAG: response regulator [Desulfobacca sp.]|uniref:response regulator n=1 Tax=Desulfobacca sp. TaxID=2067990 RepID=UPI004048FEEE